MSTKPVLEPFKKEMKNSSSSSKNREYCASMRIRDKGREGKLRRAGAKEIMSSSVNYYRFFSFLLFHLIIFILMSVSFLPSDLTQDDQVHRYFKRLDMTRALSVRPIPFCSIQLYSILFHITSSDLIFFFSCALISLSIFPRDHHSSLSLSQFVYVQFSSLKRE